MEHTKDKTGLWLGEFTDPYFKFMDAGFKVQTASPKGGKVPIDPMSTLTENITDSNRRFQKDVQAKENLDKSVKLEEVDHNTFDAVFYPGGHGPMWDLANNTKSAEIIIDFLSNNKPVAAVCHGPAALLKAAELRLGLLEGKRITAFTNTEEKLVFRSDNIPYFLEDRLVELGVDFHSAAVPYFSHIEDEGLLITGQNPASAGGVAKKLILLLNN